MPGLNSIMDSGLSALFAAQAGLATTGHNISNANTRGYNRQLVQFSARRPALTPYGAIGQGVEVQNIRRIQDEYLVNNMRVQQSRLQDFAQTDGTLYEIEAILGSVDNDHLGNAMTKFFDSWNALAQPPINTNLKANVISAAQTLVTDFHSINGSLDNLEKEIESSIQAEISNLNGMLAAVGEMNKQIMGAEAGGGMANDMRDQRDQLITEISKIADVSTLERDDGSIDLILAGRTMVARDQVTELATDYRKTDHGYELLVVTGSNKAEVRLSPGRLQGLMNSRDVQVNDVREGLNKVAAQVIEEVNSLHTQGRTNASSGLAFFTGTDMHTIEINNALLNDNDLVATGRTSDLGDNTLALELANLAAMSAFGEDEKTIGDNYRTLLVGVASDRSSFQFMVENQANVVASLETRIASVSGVSLDEEGANMVRYQNSYNAAARIISTVQQMYDTLLNMV
ncbi:MAG: flagellar hook-associated protein 1 FlgK [Candidatus Krumholzibacteriia bacterium]|jgi:flagellar hook-associated protein 1 FlgK